MILTILRSDRSEAMVLPGSKSLGSRLYRLCSFTQDLTPGHEYPRAAFSAERVCMTMFIPGTIKSAGARSPMKNILASISTEKERRCE